MVWSVGNVFLLNKLEDLCLWWLAAQLAEAGSTQRHEWLPPHTAHRLIKHVQLHKHEGCCCRTVRSGKYRLSLKYLSDLDIIGRYKKVKIFTDCLFYSLFPEKYQKSWTLVPSIRPSIHQSLPLSIHPDILLLIHPSILPSFINPSYILNF